MLITLNFIVAKIQQTTERDGRRWRSNNLGEKEETSLKKCLNMAPLSSVTVQLNHSSNSLFVPPSIVNFNFVMISVTFKVLILYKNEETYIRIKAIRTYKKFLLLLLKDQFYNLFWIFIPSILFHIMQNLRFLQ